MKYILGVYHSIYLSYIGRFGGTVNKGTYYIWWTIPAYKSITLPIEGCVFFALRKLEYMFVWHPTKNNDEAKFFHAENKTPR